MARYKVKRYDDGSIVTTDSTTGAISYGLPLYAKKCNPSTELTVNDSLGGNGTDFLDGTAVTGRAYKYLVINDDAVFAVLNDSEGNDMLVDQFYATQTVGKGMVVRANDGNLIADITMSSGSAKGVK